MSQSIEAQIKRELVAAQRRVEGLQQALAALAGKEVSVAKKAVKKVFQRSEEWRRKISISAKKRWAAVKAEKTKKIKKKK